MARYRTLGTGFDDTYRNDLNANFGDLSTDVEGLLLPATSARIADGAVVENKIETKINNRLKRGAYQVTNGLTDLIKNSDNSVTVSFNTLTIFIGNKAGAGTNGTKTVTAQKDIVIPTDAALVVDLSAASPITPFVTSGNAYNSSLWGDMAFMDDTMLILIANKGGQLHGYLNTALPKLSEDDVVLNSDGAGSVDIYVKSSTSSSRRYIKYPFRHIVDATANADVWRLNEVWEVERRSGTDFINKLMICNYGEIELAIKASGWTDNVGGSYHGNEKFTSVTFLVGGNRFSTTNVGIRTAKTVKVIVKSDLYSDLDNTQKIANVTKVYTFTKTGFILSVEVKFLTALNLNNAYLCMLPIRRLENGATGAEVTNEAMRDYDYVYYNVATSGFTNDLLTPRSGVKTTHIWGTNSGISATVEILDRKAWLPNENHFFKNEDNYNKFYYDYCGSYNVSVNEVFKQTAQISINTRN